MSRVNQLIKKVFRRIGLDISRSVPNPLVFHGVDLLLDVGANIGQYASQARSQGYVKNIVSFEPLVHEHEILLKAARNDKFWRVHERCALGAIESEMEINISNNSYSSSLLPMLDEHSNAAPNSTYVGKVATRVITLDSVLNLYCKNHEKIFLKIDTQGFEKQVLDGAKNSLKNIFAVQLELSTLPLYEGQELYQYFFSFFEKKGFYLWSLMPGFSNPISGQLLQFDAIFIKNGF